MTAAERATHHQAGSHKTHQPRSEVRDGMHIDWDVPIVDGRRARAERGRVSPA